MSSLTEAAIAELDPQERLDLIAALWDSLTDAETPLPASQRAELERRLARFEEDKGKAVDWVSLKAELRANRA
jgi:putative addiction module component (TIGR02574 family)